MFYTDTWIYFHVPKTSGTNILLNAEEYGDIRKGYNANPERHNPIWYWESKLEGKKLYTTVRNPYSRIVSLWNHLNHFKKVTFEDFVLNTIPLDYFLKSNVIMGDYKSYYTDKIQEVVYNRYKKDFLEFEYNKDL